VFVLGIDPGLSRCGYGVVRKYGSDLAATAGGVVTTDPEMPLPERLRTMFGELRALVGEVRPDAVVVERVFFQTNARTAMATGQAGGLALVAAAEAGCEVAQYTSNEVKMAVVGFGSATKDQVQRMVAALLDLPEPPRPADVADALALALCHLTAEPLRRAVEAASDRSQLEARPHRTESTTTLVTSHAVSAAAASGRPVWAADARTASETRGGLR
jgi:crossover junction endodeoxyribonuclease RuvC